MEECNEIEARISAFKKKVENETAKLLKLRLEEFIKETQYAGELEWGLDTLEYALLTDMIEPQYSGNESYEDYLYEGDRENNNLGEEYLVKHCNGAIKVWKNNRGTCGINYIEQEEELDKYDLSKLRPFDFSQLGINVTDERYRNQSKRLSKGVFEESLLREDLIDYYLSKPKGEIEETLGEEVAEMVGFQQVCWNRYGDEHNYNLWERTLKIVDAIKGEGLSTEDFKKVRVAAFFHKIGEPVRGYSDWERGRKSAFVVEPVLIKLGYSKEEREQLKFLIEVQDDFEHFIDLDYDPEDIEKSIQENIYHDISYREESKYHKMALQLCKANIDALPELYDKDKEEMSKNLSNIERHISEKLTLPTGRTERDIISDIVDVAEQKSELKEKEAKAEQLLEEYQASQDGQEVGEDTDEPTIND